jgi:hypothetical protein
MTGITTDEPLVDLATESSPRRDAALRRAPRVRKIDVLIPLACVALVAVVHPLSYELHAPYWPDEAWVATLTRTSIGNALHYASSTPLAWVLLLHAIPGGDFLRLLPLLFMAGTGVLAYFLGRRLPWPSLKWSCGAGAATALVVLCAPIAVVRSDLKQYSADAFFALLIMLLVARVDEAPSPRRYAWLAAGVIVATPFSNVAAFVGIAAFGAVFAIALVRRRHDLPALLLAGVAAAAFVSIWFGTIVIPRDTATLRHWWRGGYLSGTLWQATREAFSRISALAPLLAMPALIFAAAVLLGCVVSARMARPALALVAPLLWLEMFVLALAHHYPFAIAEHPLNYFSDSRTWLFVFEASFAIATIGVTGALLWISQRSRPVATVIGVVLALAFLHGAAPFFRSRTLPPDDVRTTTRYVNRHLRPGDVVVVSVSANWGFAYYSPRPLSFVSDSTFPNGFSVRSKGADNVFYVPNRGRSDIDDTVRAALAARGPNGRVWFVLSHVLPTEAEGFRHAEAAFNLAPRPIMIGNEPLFVVDPGAPPPGVAGPPRR